MRLWQIFCVTFIRLCNTAPAPHPYCGHGIALEVEDEGGHRLILTAVADAAVLPEH